MAKALQLLGLSNLKDIANACIYLLSDASRWVTGSNLVVDGGDTTRWGFLETNLTQICFKYWEACHYRRVECFERPLADLQ